MPEAKCLVCRGSSQGKKIHVRSGKELELYRCSKCEFDFFDIDPTVNLAADKLDETRLKAAGLEIPSVEKDFENGLRQSLPYLDEYIDESDRCRNILEIGCSIGYFLKLVRDKGANPYGLEVNAVRAHYVREHLGIPCEESLSAYLAKGIRFKKIFLFYVLEYFHEPVEYIKSLIDLLEPGGSIIAVTPNVRDVIKDVWQNPAFKKFFYDENAVAYFSPNATHQLLINAGAKSYEVTTRQGYSFLNHVSWHLTQAPRTTGIVGGDAFLPPILQTLGEDGSGLGPQLASLMQTFDKAHKEAIESADFGNQIRFVVYKS